MAARFGDARDIARARQAHVHAERYLARLHHFFQLIRQESDLSHGNSSWCAKCTAFMCYAPLHPSTQMTPEPACPRCSRVFSPEDAVERYADRVVHVDCLMPRRLTREERVLLFEYCWDHGVVECVPCSRIFRQEELFVSVFGSGMDRCPKCRADLTDGIRAHLYSCSMLPATVRRRAQETRAAAQQLVKQSNQLYDRPDVLLREAEALRDALKRSAPEALRRLIQVKLRDGSLPHDKGSAILPGRRGDGSRCQACDRVITNRSLMIVIARRTAPLSLEEGPFQLHADCFDLWNEERQRFKPNA